MRYLAFVVLAVVSGCEKVAVKPEVDAVPLPALAVASDSAVKQAIDPVLMAIRAASTGALDAKPTVTPNAIDVAEFPEKYSGQCVSLNGCQVSGDATLKDGIYWLRIKDDREQEYDSSSPLRFTCDKGLVDVIRSKIKSTQLVSARLYCRIESVGENDKSPQAISWVYKVIATNESGIPVEIWTSTGTSKAPRIKYVLNSKNELVPIEE